jgi:3-oxoacyl-(acyl-carrier-protein) synthase
VRQQRTRPKLLELDENIANLAIESAQDPHALYLNKLSIGFTPDCDLDFVPNIARSTHLEYALSNSFAFRRPERGAGLSTSS